MNRADRRAHARGLRAKRRDLVHAAGCMSDDCVVRRAAFDDYHLANEAMADGVRVPRSMVRAIYRAESPLSSMAAASRSTSE